MTDMNHVLSVDVFSSTYQFAETQC